MPETGAIVRVKVPRYNQSQPGGPGLLDVRDYLEAKDRIAEDFLNRNLLTANPDGLTEEEGFKIVDVKVEKTSEFISMVHIPLLFNINLTRVAHPIQQG